jgi:hypothetical protein
MASPLHDGTPAGLIEYIEKNKGLQHASRFRVSIQRIGEEIDEKHIFLCGLAQVPNAKIKIYQDVLSGSASIIPIPYGIEYSGNLLEFIIEESWASRSYFENWQSSIFARSGGVIHEVPVFNNRVRFYEDVIGKIEIEAISIGKPAENTTPLKYELYGCIPMEIVPTQFESLNGFNNVLKFSVNMIYRYYTVKTEKTTSN